MATEQHHEAPEIGSRFYAWGHHVTVVEHGQRDGEPAVRLHRDGDPKPEPIMVTAHLFLRRAVPSQKGTHA